MNKIVLACVLAISCSTVRGAQGAATTYPSNLPASSSTADEQPPLHGALPLAPLNRATPATPSLSAPATPSDELQNELKKFDDMMPTMQQTLPPGALQGTANIVDIEFAARNLKDCPLQRDRDKGLKYVEVTVKNSGQNIAVILGNSAQADVSAGKIASAPASAAVDSDLPRLNGKGKLAVGVVAAFSFGYAAPIFYENLTPDQHAKRSLGEAIGRDGSRREVEAGHFGVRVIMPGDETTGWIAFRCPRDQAVKSLTIPVSYTRSAVPAGSVTVPVGDGPAN
ncbi:MAG: hypothetical protein JST89_02695 [Cyanobacteria bacterium SZAS-4]|nr:hypothetical protein [Cyanobacteria bacterium SZAS-4]